MATEPVVKSMSTITSGEALRNEQHVLTDHVDSFINDRPPYGISLRPLATERHKEHIGKEASP
jgi:hypothetical protein